MANSVSNYPWHDRETLYQKYVVEGKSGEQVADELGCDTSTVFKWMHRLDVPVRQAKHQMRDRAWRDKEAMEEMYLEKGMSTREIAEELDCKNPTIFKWLHRHGIPTRQPYSEKPPSFRTDHEGHEIIQTKTGGVHRTVFVHRLIAVAEYGLDAIRDKVIHHDNGIPWDNRPENLEIMSRKKHRQHHMNQHWERKKSKGGGD